MYVVMTAVARRKVQLPVSTTRYVLGSMTYPLYLTQLDGSVRGIPVSFAVDGKQYVAIAAGFALFVYGLP